MIRCPKCQKEVPEDSKFCKVCGAKIMTLKEKEKSTKKKAIAIIAVLLAILIALSGFIIFNKISDKPDITRENSENHKSENDTIKNDKNNGNNKNESNNNNTVNNDKTNEDVYKAPDGKYYVPSNYKIYICEDNSDETIIEHDCVWYENSVNYPEPYCNWFYEFNDDGQILSKKSSFEDDFSDVMNFVEYVYDDNGKLLNAGSTEYFYDENGNLIKISSDIYMPDDYVVENNIELTYDNQNRCTNILFDVDYGFPTEIKITYNNDNSIKFTTTDYNGDKHNYTVFYNEFDKISGFESDDDRFNYASFTYDENHNLTKVIFTGISEDDIEISGYIEFEWQEGTKSQAVFADKLISEDLIELSEIEDYPIFTNYYYSSDFYTYQ